MKKCYLISITALIILGCSNVVMPLASTPTPEPSPTPIVIYKSPSDMNLRSGDISNLILSDVQDPDESPLLPEATDQSQRAFINESLDINIESSVYILPSISQRKISQIYDLVIPKRRPASRKSVDEVKANIGEQSLIFEITDTCGHGYVLIFKRSNVVAVVIGCGTGVNVDFITQIGLIIDGHTTISHEAECASLRLTPQECTNSGTHYYLLSGVIEGEYGNHYCYFKNDEKNIQEKTEVTLLFSPGDMAEIFSVNHQKVGQNSYSGSYRWEEGNGDITSALTLQDNGFTLIQTYAGICSGSSCGCTWHEEYSLIK